LRHGTRAFNSRKKERLQQASPRTPIASKFDTPMPHQETRRRTTIAIEAETTRFHSM
jgi:hypothetical protein